MTTEKGQPSVELDHIVTKFPDHRTLGKALQDGVNATMDQLREARGKVVTPEDTYETVRWAQGIAESFHEYGRAFAGAAALVGQYAEEELVEAVGEQDGIPTRGLTVPDVDGSDIKITKETSNTHHIDRDAVLRALAVSFVHQHDAAGMLAELLSDLYARVEMVDESTEEQVYRRAEEHLATLLILAFGELAALGTFNLQVTKVEAFSKELARRDALLASTVTGAMRKTVKYSGVKMSRTFPKSKEKPSG